jgi:uncharacterized protein (DUF2062 family)
VFIGNLPLYGGHAPLSLLVARRLKLNPLAVLVGSHISTPPLGGLLAIAAIATGHWLIHGSVPGLAAFDPRHVGYWPLLRNVLIEWTIGSIICGLVLALITYLLSRLAVHLLTRAPAADQASLAAPREHTPAPGATRAAALPPIHDRAVAG